MWAIIMFDLPSASGAEKKRHAQFRTQLLRRGFQMLQWSVYARCYPNADASSAHVTQLEKLVPSGGRVRILVVTDKQFEKMTCIDRDVRRNPEEKIGVVVLFD